MSSDEIFGSSIRPEQNDYNSLSSVSNVRQMMTNEYMSPTSRNTLRHENLALPISHRSLFEGMLRANDLVSDVRLEGKEQLRKSQRPRNETDAVHMTDRLDRGTFGRMPVNADDVMLKISFPSMEIPMDRTRHVDSHHGLRQQGVASMDQYCGPVSLGLGHSSHEACDRPSLFSCFSCSGM
jgi:hypothetical protein